MKVGWYPISIARRITSNFANVSLYPSPTKARTSPLYTGTTPERRHAIPPHCLSSSHSRWKRVKTATAAPWRRAPHTMLNAYGSASRVAIVKMKRPPAATSSSRASSATDVFSTASSSSRFGSATRRGSSFERSDVAVSADCCVSGGLFRM